jgi:integrase
VYYITYKKDGKKIEEKVGREYADNMKPRTAALIRGERIENKRPSRKEIREEQKRRAEESKKNNSLEDIYLEYKKMFPRKNNLNYDGILKNHLSKIKDMQINELTTQIVDEVKFKAYKSGLSDQTVHHVLAMIKLLVNFADKYGYCDKPPSSQLRFNMPKVDNKKTENMSETQFKAYLKALDEEPDQNAANCLRLALLTGMRRTALFNLKWKDIDFTTGMITLRGDVAKKGKTTNIPMSDEARKILQEEKEKHLNHIYVFPGIDGGPRKEMRRVARRVREKAGLDKDFRPMHGLRHTYASKLVSSGVSLATLQKLLTHESPDMTNRYAHLEDKELKRAANVAGGIYKSAEKPDDNGEEHGQG